MGFHSSFISLRRLLLGAALVVFGLFLASSTTAQADDLGVTKTLNKLVTVTDVPAILDPATTPTTAVVEQSVENVTAALKPAETVTAIIQPIEAVVEAPLKAVDPALAQPVKDVVTATTSTVTKATAAVTTTTSAVSRTVEPLLTVSEEAVEPVVTLVDTIVPVASPPSLADLPDVIEPPQDLLAGETLSAPEQSAELATSVVDRARTQRAIQAEQALAPTLVDRPSAVAPWSASGLEMGPAASTVRPAASHTPVHQPTMPSPTHRPTPALPAGGAVPGSGAHGSSAPVGGDLAITPTSLALPEDSSAAMRSSTLHPRPGPVADPGSRPD